jgi:prevent-host-death family protein
MFNMSTYRTITASDAKAKLGEVLASLAVQGPIEITRNGRLVGVLTPPESIARAENSPHLSALAALYAAGAVSWQRISDETGASFGELLAELARQELQLPRVAARKRPEQAAVFEEALAQAKRSRSV